jgi:ABC-2 type transport system permease protein
VFASMRAELLVLRKWPAAWGLLAITPLLVLLSDYVAEWIFYLTLTPAYYSSEGTPAQNLQGLLPSQFNIIAVFQFTFAGTAPFIVLGAAMAGGDWGRGTITTALLQGPGRARTFAGQVGALMVAATASVLATFAVAAAASSVIRLVEARSVNPVAGAMPGFGVIAESFGAALLVAIAYGVVGLFLGTVFRSAAGAVAVALVWTLIVEGTLWDLSLQLPRGLIRTITDLTLNASAVTVTGDFGTPGGGAGSQNYLIVRPAVAIATLLAYIAVSLVLTLLVLRRRDAVPATSRRLRLNRWQYRPQRWRRSAGSSGRDRQRRTRPRRAEPAVTGVLAALRAELLIMRKRPAVWALILVLPVDMLINSYGYAYVLYATANSGVSLGVNAPQVLSSLLPDQYLMAALSGGFGAFNQVNGVVVFMLLGALVGGSDWGRNTIRTALLQGPGRWRTAAGQSLALVVAVAASVALTFVLAAAASEIIALHQTGSLAPAGSQFPAAGHVAVALGAALVLGLAYMAIGLTLGVWLRSAGAAIGAVLLWAVVVEPSIEYFAGQLHGIIVRVYQLLPDASTNSLVNLDGTPSYYYGLGQPQGHVGTLLAFGILGLYAAAFLTVPALITRRRDIA